MTTPNPLPSFGQMRDGIYELRDQKITTLIAQADFIDTLWFTWTNKHLGDGERVLLNACLVAAIDHGQAPPSAQVTRTVASCAKPLADSVAAGLLTLGPRHGNAAGAASTWLRDALASQKPASLLASEALSQQQKIPGFGHPEYSIDPRTTALSALAKKHLSQTKHLDFAEEVRGELSTLKGKDLALNIDGAIGAIIADLGAEPVYADALFLCARTFGLTAHALEEASQATTYRRG